MILGLLSDTHSRASTARLAVRMLLDGGAEFLIHCGDVGSEDVLDALAGVPSAFVFGNCDYDRDALDRYAGMIGVQCLKTYGVLTLAGKNIAVTHGDDFHLMQRLTRGLDHDYLFTGHTHQRHDRRVEAMRWINPGALHRAIPKTVATLNLLTDDLSYLTVQEE